MTAGERAFVGMVLFFAAAIAAGLGVICVIR